MIAALYVDTRRGPYASIPGVECWGVERDAGAYPGPWKVVAHPPCGPWGGLSHLCTQQDPRCAVDAVGFVRRFGGVLEHPKGSRLWDACRMPAPGGLPDAYGGWTLEVDQCRWGHPALKMTWLYIVGTTEVPTIPPPGTPTRLIDSPKSQKNRQTDRLLHLPKSQRHLTPPAFAAWLVEVATSAAAP